MFRQASIRYDSSAFYDRYSTPPNMVSNMVYSSMWKGVEFLSSSGFCQVYQNKDVLPLPPRCPPIGGLEMALRAPIWHNKPWWFLSSHLVSEWFIPPYRCLDQCWTCYMWMHGMNINAWWVCQGESIFGYPSYYLGQYHINTKFANLHRYESSCMVYRPGWYKRTYCLILITKLVKKYEILIIDIQMV